MSSGFEHTTVDPNPLVSVVTPAYNEADRGFLLQTLDSVSSQNYSRIEHIVVDDGSTDNTAALVTEYNHTHELVLIQQENQGMVAAVNRGIEAAQGDIIIWLNGDDILVKTTTVDRVVEAFERNPSTDFVYGHQLHIGPDDSVQDVRVPHPNANFSRLALNNFGIFVFLNGDTLRSLELNPDYQHSADYELYVRGAARGASFTYVRDPLYGHRHHDDRKTEKLLPELQAEANRVRNEYGVVQNTRFAARQFFLYKQLDILQLRGVRAIWEIYRHPDRYVGDITVDPVDEAVLSQLRDSFPI